MERRRVAGGNPAVPSYQQLVTRVLELEDRVAELDRDPPCPCGCGGVLVRRASPPEPDVAVKLFDLAYLRRNWLRTIGDSLVVAVVILALLVFGSKIGALL